MKGFFVSTVSLLMSLLVSSPTIDAFCPLGAARTTPESHYTALLFNKKKNEYEVEKSASRRDFIANVIGGGMAFGVLTTTLTSIPQPAIAEEIKTLDMSLPTYDSINTLKTSAETAKALGVETPPEEKATAAPRKKKSSSSGGGGGGGGGNPLANVLPSMNKSVVRKSRNTGQATATTTNERPKRVKEEKPAEDEIKTMDLSLPSYSEGVQGKEKSAFAL